MIPVRENSEVVIIYPDKSKVRDEIHVGLLKGIAQNSHVSLFKM